MDRIGAPAEVHARPASTFVAGFTDAPATNLIDGVLEGGALRAGDVSMALTLGAP